MARCAVLVILILGLTASAASTSGAAPSQVTLGLGTEPLTLLGNTVNDTTTDTQIVNIYDTLLMRDRATAKIIPWLATSYRVLNDRTWEFALRRNVQFHDGERFDARAGKFLFDYILDPQNKSPYLSYFKPVQNVEIVNDYTIRVHTSEPFPGLPALLTDMFVMSPLYVEKVGPQYAATHPVGTGPYKIREWSRGERLVLSKNPNYWAGPAKLETVVFRVIPEFSARLAALLSGEIDIMKDVPPQAVQSVNASGRATVHPIVSTRINYLALETLHPGPMQDVRVRQAVNYAVNVDELINTVLAGQATRICGYVSRYDPSYDPSLPCYTYDPQKAAQLLQEAGYDPRKLTLTLDSPNGRYPLDKEVSEAIAAQLGKLGIVVHVRVNEWRSHLDKIVNRTVGDMYFLGAGPSLDPNTVAIPLFKQGNVYSSFQDPRIQALINQAQVTVDPNASYAAFRRVQQALHSLAPWVSLWQQHDLYGIANWISWQPRPDEELWMWESGPK